MLRYGLPAGKPSQHVTSHAGQLSLLPSAGREMSTDQREYICVGYNCTVWSGICECNEPLYTVL